MISSRNLLYQTLRNIPSTMNYPYEITEPDEELAEKIRGKRSPAILIGPKKYIFPKYMEDKFPKYYDFEARPDDVWLYGYPRSGTTLSQEIIWLLENNLDFKRASEEVLDFRFPILERDGLFDEQHVNLIRNPVDEKTLQLAKRLVEPATDLLEDMEGKRLIKTHLPPSLGPSNLLESGCKMIYVARNPRDVIPSMYNFCRDFGIWKNDFAKYWEYFEAGLAICCPIFEHIKEGWALRHHKNVLFLFYEDLNKNLRESLIRIAEFLGKSLTDQQLDQLEEHLKIDNFRKNKSVNYDHFQTLGVFNGNDKFIRNGKVNSGNDYFTGPLAEKVDEWIQRNLQGTDLKFPS